MISHIHCSVSLLVNPVFSPEQSLALPSVTVAVVFLPSQAGFTTETLSICVIPCDVFSTSTCLKAYSFSDTKCVLQILNQYFFLM